MDKKILIIVIFCYLAFSMSDFSINVNKKIMVEDFLSLSYMIVGVFLINLGSEKKF
jgi:hypothetical protein